MIELNLLSDCSEIVSYNFDKFPIRAKKAQLSDYLNMSATNHWHHDFEFTIILSGKMNYSINGKHYFLKEGQAIFINSGNMHYGYSSDKTDCIFICIVLNPLFFAGIEYIRDTYINPICSDTAHPFFIFDPTISWQKDLIENLKNIYKLCNEEKEGFELQVMNKFYLICYNLYENVKNDRLYQETFYNKNVDILHNMVGYIQKNYKNKVTLEEISASGNVCRSNCCKIFHSILNKSPISYLMEYRLDKSIKLLHSTSHSITEIALECGFNSSSYFTEVFRKTLGITPTEYRKFYIKK